MGCLSKCFGFTSSRRHDRLYEDQYNHDLEMALAMSRSEQDEITRQNIEADEQFARAIEESSKHDESSHYKEEERQHPRVQIEDNQQLALTVQNSLDKEETFPFQTEQRERQDDRIQLEEHQWLPGTIEESLNVRRSPQLDSVEADFSRKLREKGKGKHAEDQANESPLSICTGCNSTIEHGRSVNVLGSVWHPECFCCLACHAPIAVHEFSNSRGQFHKSCFKGRRDRNCYVCKQKIPSTAEGRVFKEHRFWKGKYCPSHENDGTSMCCSCERLEPWGTNYVILDDGRRQCLECYDSAIMDTYECQTLHFDIRDFFESLNLKVEKEFPLLLVESQALNKAKKDEHIDHSYAVVTRGLCLSEEHIVPSISRGPTKGPNNRLIGLTTESYTLTRTCEVTAILIMYGLPRLLTGSILAHEMMHAWLRLKGYRNLNPELEEGICQVLAHRWLESQTYNSVDTAAPSSSSSSSYSASTTKKGDQPEFERKLVDFFKWQIEEDDSPVYGDGFRKVNKVVLEEGSLLETIRSWRAYRQFH